MINVLYLYPDLLNLHGDRGNILAILNVAKKLNVKIKIDRLDDINKPLNLKKYDLILISPGEIKVILKVKDKLLEYKDEIKDFIDKKYIVAIGTSGLIFANNIKRINDNYTGLDIGNFDCIERLQPFGDDLIFNYNNEIIVGSQIQMVDYILKDNNYISNTIYGYGNCDNKEGIMYKNLIITNCLGPVFIKNPWFIESILKDICNKKNIKYKNKLTYKIEKLSQNAIIEFNKNK